MTRDAIGKITEFIESNKKNKLSVVLDTSIILESTENIKKLKNYKKYADFYIPENCYYELLLLTSHSEAKERRRKAKLILRSFRNICKDYHTLISGKTKLREELSCKSCLFIFYEPLQAIDFCKKLGFAKMKKAYVFSADSYSDSCGIYEAGSRIRHTCKSVFGTEIINTNESPVLKLYDKKMKECGTITRSKLSSMDEGGEAEIYSTEEHPGHCVKLFTGQLPSENGITKLRTLMGIGKHLKCGAFPTALVYDGDTCVGFAMKKFKGKTISRLDTDYFYKLPYKKQRELILKLLTALLEMRLCQLYVVDLSAGNIMITDDFEIVFLDIDSCQFGSFAGGGYTPYFAHPDMTPDYVYKLLRKPEHINFPLATLFFRLYTNRDNPMCQAGLDHSPEYKKDAFPYANSSFLKIGCELKKGILNKNYLRRWKTLPLALRIAFIENFNFERIYTIGNWAQCFYSI